MVSIIVPNYNHSKFLKNRLDSIFNQTYQDFEVILLDDCSTDNSTDILKMYAKEKAVSHFIVNDKNSGNPFIQWKKGLQLAKGEYIWIAESDDWADEQFLLKMVNILEEKPKLALAYSQSYVVDENDKKLGSNIEYTSIFKPNKWKSSYVNNGNNELINCMAVKNTIPNASAVVFRNIVSIEEYINLEFTTCGDWWFWINLVYNKKLAFLNEHLNYYRTHSATTRVRDTYYKRRSFFFEKLRVLKLLDELFPDIDYSYPIKELFDTYPFPTNIEDFQFFQKAYFQEFGEKLSFYNYFTNKIKIDILRALNKNQTIVLGT